MERLQKKIANSGYTSRRKAEDLIKTGHVYVNNKLITELGYQVKEKDEIRIDNEVITNEEKVYFLLNKPRGYISSTTDEKNRKTIIDLIDTDKRIFPVGRLDYDTTGAIILTNDGELANLIMHPKNKIDKTYIAKVKGFLTKDEINRLRNGVTINNFKTSKAHVKVRSYDKIKNTSIVEITIHEGKNHQVKNMFKEVGKEVIKLKRESIAFLNIKNLSSKEYRVLTPKEVKKLYSIIKM